MPSPARLFRTIRQFFTMPKLTINLMYTETLKNDPFYQRSVLDFYNHTRKRHRKLPIFRNYEYGVAVAVLPSTYDEYLKLIEPSARRNIKKAERNGYTFQRINFNDYLEDARAIVKSTDVRQGRPIDQDVAPCSDPPSNNPLHDYPKYGIFRDGKMIAFISCLISGEVCMLATIFGHAAYQQDGVVPMIMVNMAKTLYADYPRVKYYMYDTFFGARETMRRFKTKMGFVPHHVKWNLG